MFFEVRIDFNQYRFKCGLGKHLTAARQYLMFDTVDVDLDMRGQRNGGRCHQLVERGCKAPLDNLRGTRSQFEVERLPISMYGTAGNEFTQVQRGPTAGVGERRAIAGDSV